MTTLNFMYEQVSMSKIRQRLASKHQEIAERLTLMLTKSVKDQAQVTPTQELKCYSIAAYKSTPFSSCHIFDHAAPPPDVFISQAYLSAPVFLRDWTCWLVATGNLGLMTSTTHESISPLPA